MNISSNIDGDSNASTTDDEPNCVPATHKPEEFYEMSSKQGHYLGKVKVVKINIGELVHCKDERKVLDHEVNDANKAEAEKEFSEGSFLCVNEIIAQKTFL